MGASAEFLRRDLSLLASLYLVEASIAVMAMAMYMKGERSVAEFLYSWPGLACVAALALLLGGCLIVTSLYLENRRVFSCHFRLVVTMNLITVVLALGAGELVVRAGASSFFEHEAIGTVVLRPKHWEATKDRYRQLLDEARSYVSYLEYDDRMGWRVGANRQGSQGLYWTSPEGLRAPHEGVSFARVTEQTDIALVGDSFTFGEEVSYGETYGAYLEQMLGTRFRVLNFGVPGYGLDQMYLRYEKDVRAWKPKIVILGFISHDLVRTLWVYPFLGNHAWDFPFPAPRFTLRDGRLVNLTKTLPPPEAIFARESISELPMLQYQKEYKPSDWEERLAHFSYLIRLFVSWFPPWTTTHHEVSDEALVSINAAILKEFVRLVRQDGAIPVVAYFPRKSEIEKPSLRLSSGVEKQSDRATIALRVLDQSGIRYSDTTPCLLELASPESVYRPRNHYAPEGNAAVAKCVYKYIREVLG